MTQRRVREREEYDKFQCKIDDAAAAKQAGEWMEARRVHGQGSREAQEAEL
jgi:hypothetical protein